MEENVSDVRRQVEKRTACLLDFIVLGAVGIFQMLILIDLYFAVVAVMDFFFLDVP